MKKNIKRDTKKKSTVEVLLMVCKMIIAVLRVILVILMIRERMTSKQSLPESNEDEIIA